MAKKGTTQKTEVLPIAKQNYALAKANADFREGYLLQALRLGDCKSIEQVQIKFNESNQHIMFLRSVGVIGQDK